VGREDSSTAGDTGDIGDARSDVAATNDAAPGDAPGDVGPFQDVVSLQCPPAGEPEPPEHTQNCDTFDFGVCERWAEDLQRRYAAPDAMVYAACETNAAMLDDGYWTGCVRAERCTGALNGTLHAVAPCYCGAGPACGPGQLCIRNTPTGMAHCECIVHP
jgi:hypothetical protein